MSESFLLLASLAITVGFILFAIAGKASWKSVTRKATASLCLLWLVGAVLFAANIGGGGGELNYDGSNFSISRDSSQDNFIGALVVLAAIAVVGGLLSVILPDNKPDSEAS